MGEHELFFYQWWKNNFTCAISFDILFGEAVDKTYLLNGKELRGRATSMQQLLYNNVTFIEDTDASESNTQNRENFKPGYLPPLKKKTNQVNYLAMIQNHFL